jgi:hypothetical protein
LISVVIIQRSNETIARRTLSKKQKEDAEDGKSNLGSNTIDEYVEFMCGRGAHYQWSRPSLWMA